MLDLQSISDWFWRGKIKKYHDMSQQINLLPISSIFNRFSIVLQNNRVKNVLNKFFSSLTNKGWYGR